MTKIKLTACFNDIISIENLLEAWKEFLKGKRKRKDVQQFEFDLMSNIISLHNDLVSKIYKHSEYQAFKICDPKPRDIHKASVRDRLLHHAVYRILYPYFDKTFIPDSYSCRLNKGTHKAMDRFRSFAFQESQNHTRTTWVLKGDIRKFFASIDHLILLDILQHHIPDNDINWLLAEIIGSFYSTGKGKGLPLGNLTSQLLVNIYMNKFDQFVKHKLKAEHYVRYADDFVVLSEDKFLLEVILAQMDIFLRQELKLELHPLKVSITTFASSIDFLGWVHFTDHRVLRTVSKRRMFKKIKLNPNNDTLQSYLGLLGHGNAHTLKERIRGL